MSLTRAVATDEPLLADLLRGYVRELSDVFGLRPGADGRFGYDRLPRYFTDPTRTPCLLHADTAIAGFALVSRGSAVTGARDVHDLREFFVLPALRRRGIGRIAAAQVFRAFPGTWEVRAFDRNPGAVAFWTRAIDGHTAGAFETVAWQPEPDRTWTVFRFVSP